MCATRKNEAPRVWVKWTGHAAHGAARVRPHDGRRGAREGYTSVHINIHVCVRVCVWKVSSCLCRAYECQEGGRHTREGSLPLPSPPSEPCCSSPAPPTNRAKAPRDAMDPPSSLALPPPPRKHAFHKTKQNKTGPPPALCPVGAHRPAQRLRDERTRRAHEPPRCTCLSCLLVKGYGEGVEGRGGARAVDTSPDVKKWFQGRGFCLPRLKSGPLLS